MRRYYIDFINNKVVEDEQGYYVPYDDVEAIVAENERLKNVVKSQKDLIALNNKDATKFREENERLKASIKVMHTECDTCWKIEELQKENAKLKCLSLHGLYLHCERRAFEADPYLPTKWEYYWEKFERAYRKAKAELKEGKYDEI